MKKKQKSWGTYTELTNEEAVRKHGKSLMFVGRAPAAPRKKTLKDVYKGAASALTFQFDEAKPEEGESLRKENNNG